jgi:2-polyprenyl-3-methyl-5-hydroxy-6-metoxy-1,4-benzoquinol methylase|tara:strand:+ start:424 stop:1068 length:645 start_codon:yes stop_codon:yes gene_type:complete
MESTSQIYAKHNLEKRGRGFVLFERERGGFISNAIGKGKKIVDLGSRDGSLTKYVAQENEVWAVDIDKAALAYLKEMMPSIETMYLDLNQDNWDLPKNYFDAVVTAETLEHLYYPENVLARISDLLKNGGIIAGSVPNAFSLKNRVRMFFGKKQHSSLGDPTHINHFSFTELEELLKKYFKQVRIYPLIQPKYRWLSKISPKLFSFSLLFWAKK